MINDFRKNNKSRDRKISFPQTYVFITVFERAISHNIHDDNNNNNVIIVSRVTRILLRSDAGKTFIGLG